MSKDIDEMENMLNDYLQFARTQSQENTSIINFQDLFNEIKKNSNNDNLILENIMKYLGNIEEKDFLLLLVMNYLKEFCN